MSLSRVMACQFIFITKERREELWWVSRGVGVCERDKRNEKKKKTKTGGMYESQ